MCRNGFSFITGITLGDVYNFKVIPLSLTQFIAMIGMFYDCVRVFICLSDAMKY